MSKVSRQELEVRISELEKYIHVLLQGLHCSLSSEIEWIVTEKEKDGGKYKFGVARLDSPNGGLFFTRFDYPNQQPSFDVALLDTVLSDCRDSPSGGFSRVRVHALDKAATMRYRAIHKN